MASARLKLSLLARILERYDEVILSIAKDLGITIRRMVAYGII